MITSPILSCRDVNPVQSANPWQSMGAELRQLEEDREALRQREQNLQEYEGRLRALQAQIERTRSNGAAVAASPSGVTPSIFHQVPAQRPSGSDPELQAGWEKLHRARELLDAEQAHLRQDRLALREHDAALQRREAAIAARERDLEAREATAQPVTAVPSGPTPGVAAPSAVGMLSRAPFDLARRMLGKRTE